MDDLANNLEVLIQRATNPKSAVPDSAAAVEICSILTRDPYSAHTVTRLLATRIQSMHEIEALRGLMLLDSCMKHCGAIFHSEVGKFRFLNEMIKLVSPKYLGEKTPAAVKRRVLQLMHSWTQEYPRELKIREAYDMLKKQGVVTDEPPPYIRNASDNAFPTPPPRAKNSIFEDGERSRLLQKLLQSKNPDDLQAANRLIKNMVKEDERRVELSSRCITEIETAQNNARLLSEMLDSYRPGQSSAEELELINELHHSCERLRPNIVHYVSETADNESLLNNVLSASDELEQVLDKYVSVIVQGKVVQVPKPATSPSSLLDLSSPSEEKLPPVGANLLVDSLSELGLPADATPPLKSVDPPSDLEVLGDIFGNISTMTTEDRATSPLTPSTILLPLTVQSSSKGEMMTVTEPEKPSKMKALEDLDALGESLLKQNLPTSCKVGSPFAKPLSKVPMNLLAKQQDGSPPSESAPSSSLVGASSNGDKQPSLDIDFLIGGSLKPSAPVASNFITASDLLNGDDSLVDLSDDVPADSEPVRKISDASSDSSGKAPRVTSDSPGIVLQTNSDLSLKSIPVNRESPDKPLKTEKTDVAEMKKAEIKPLHDINVSLDSIKPGN